MNHMGEKIASKRKAAGLTQIEFAEKLSVTRQTVSRWEAGTVMPDIEKISDIASILGVSCDYLLKDELETEEFSSADADAGEDHQLCRRAAVRVKPELRGLVFHSDKALGRSGVAEAHKGRDSVDEGYARHDQPIRAVHAARASA